MKHVALLLVLASGCVGPLGALRKEQPLALGVATFTLKSDGTIDADVAKVEAAITRAPVGLARWSGLVAPVTVYVVSTHETLERAVGRRGYGWLRAWARYDDVIFQAPSTWSTSTEIVDQLVLHELTHCLLFQRSGTKDTWKDKNIPLWFREGMAIATAAQQRLYPSLEDTAHFLELNPELDVFADGDALSASRYLEVYGFALHAFAFLERRFGAEKLVALMAAMQAGDDFPAAFERALGTPALGFQRDFLNYLKWRAFRGNGRGVPRQQLDLRKLLEDRRRLAPPTLQSP